MKLFVAIVFCIVFATVFGDLNEDLRTNIKAAGEKCQKDPATAVDKDAMKAYLQSKGQGPEPANAGPHALCVSKELKWQTADGKIDKEFFKGRFQFYQIDLAKYDEFLAECGNEQETEIDTAKYLFKCIFKRHPELKQT